MQAVGAYLRALRNDKGLTQEAAATAAGIVGRTLGRWELGQNEATVRRLRPLVVVLGGSMRDAAQLLAEGDDAAAGERKARDWLKLTPQERERIIRIVSEEEDELATLVEELEQLAFGNGNRIAHLRGLVGAWRADSPGP